MSSIFEQGTRFIWENARLLERALFEYYFFDTSPDRVLSILRTYQMEDGGFGHALEPDLRAPDSQPLFVEFAFHTLYHWDLRDADLAYRACDFLSAHADLSRGVPTLFPSSQGYPRADHMLHAGWLEPSVDRLVGLVGMLNWQGVRHPWLPSAVDACLEHVSSLHYDDAHTIKTAFCLVDSTSRSHPNLSLLDKLSSELMRSDYFCLEAPVTRYCQTPLDFAPFPGSFCRPIFTGAQLDAHLDDLLSQQQPDGGWPILWNPPSDMARCEWRAQKTLQALATLRAYGRI